MTLALEINDAGILACGLPMRRAAGRGARHRDARRRGRLTGEAAASRARLKPLFAENRFWQDLADAPLARPLPGPGRWRS